MQIEYKGRGYFSGKSHQFKASVFRPGSGSYSSAAHTIEGFWHTTSKNSKNGVPFTDVTGPKEEVTVLPIENQSPWESRKLWSAVAKGIREGDFDTASKEKSKIENEQRQRRKDEQAAGSPWQLKHFVHVDNDPTCKLLF
jgi:oxysterol-binding protein-related protein 9/10/11